GPARPENQDRKASMRRPPRRSRTAAAAKEMSRAAARWQVGPSRRGRRGTWIAPTAPDRQSPRSPRSSLRAHQREELALGRGDLLCLELAFGALPASDRRQNRALDAIAVTLGLYQGVAKGDQPRLFPIAPEHVAETGLTAREPYRGARHRHLADVERCAVAADAAPRHQEPAFRRAYLIVMQCGSDRFEILRHLGAAASGEHRHHFAPAAMEIEIRA